MKRNTDLDRFRTPEKQAQFVLSMRASLKADIYETKQQLSLIDWELWPILIDAIEKRLAWCKQELLAHQTNGVKRPEV